MAKRETWRINYQLTAGMVEDFLFDPLMASRVLLGMELPPHQELRLLQMWTSSFMIDDSGFSTGKSTTIAIVAALRSILIPERFAGIVAWTFRQGKLVFDIIERMSKRSRILRSCIATSQGKPRITHGTEVWEMHFRGGSIIRALPPNFAQHGDSLRGERWNDGFFDEWPVFDVTTLTKTLLGRVTKANDYADCPVRRNHTFLSGTPGEENDPAYAVVRRVDRNIELGACDYAHWTSNYRHVPRIKRWSFLVDRRKIHEMQTLNPPSIVESEVDGRWRKSTTAYYNEHAQIIPCRIYPTAQIHKGVNTNDVFLMAYDTASTGVEESVKSENPTKTDDFSVHILKAPGGDRTAKPISVYAERWNGLTDLEMASCIFRLAEAFNVSWIMFDPGGGGIFVSHKLNAYSWEDHEGTHATTPIVSIGSKNWDGRRILIPFKRAVKPIDRLWGSMKDDGILVNHMHRLVASMLTDECILLPKPVTSMEWGIARTTPTPNEKRDYMNMHGAVLFSSNREEYAMRELDIAFSQLACIDVLRDKQTGQPVRKNGMLVFRAKGKKDAAYSFCYSVVLHALWRKNCIEEDSGSSSALTSIAIRDAVNQEFDAMNLYGETY